MSAFSIRRVLIALILCAAACSLLTGTLLAFFHPEAPENIFNRTLTFAERVAYQRAIEEIYWRHRIWPNANPGLKPPVDAVISREQIEKKVEGYLRKSQSIVDQRGWPITASELQAEMERMASHTLHPRVLLELFRVLDNDPFVIAECLARPLVAERLCTQLGGQRGVEALVPNAKTLTAATALTSQSYKLPRVSVPLDCADDTWTATSTVNAPDARSDHTLVWTGSEMIVWGGYDGNSDVNTGGRYDPATDSWTPTSITNAPIGRWLHTAVWTGSEMIVWGGGDGTHFLNTGGRYDPTNDTWVATSTISAPEGRVHHTVVWTGSQMIVWGGYNYTNLRMNSGGQYNPSTDSWIATSLTKAPEARWDHTAEWTGSEMIVWGGTNNTTYLNTGAKYTSTDNSWTPTSTAGSPRGRIGHTSVWSGSEMIVWGGVDISSTALNTGGRYDPTQDSWMGTTTTNAPDARTNQTAVWTGSEMIVWGGYCCSPTIDFNTGGRYNAGTDSWTATSIANAPFARSSLQATNFAVWTGSEMIVWGGYNYETQMFFNSGGKYCAQSGPMPTPTPTPVGITLSASGRKVGGINTVRLSWSGANSATIDVYRDRALIVTTANDGLYTDSTGETGRARYTYRVCEAGGSTCSNDVRVRFRQ